MKRQIPITFIFILSLILSFTVLSSCSSDYDQKTSVSEGEFTGIDTEDKLIRKINSDFCFYIDRKVDDCLNDFLSVSHYPSLVFSSMTDTASFSKDIEQSLNREITADGLSDVLNTDVQNFNKQNGCYAFNDNKIKCMSDKLNSDTTLINNSHAVNNAITYSSSELTVLGEVIGKYLIGFIVFGIVFHFVFPMISRRKEGARNTNSIIECAIYVLLVIIMLLLMRNEVAATKERLHKSISDAYVSTIINIDCDSADSKPVNDTVNVNDGKVKDADVPDNMFSNTVYKHYYNERWKYSIRYPDFLTVIEESGNGDGCSISDAETGIELRTYGIWNAMDQSIEDLFGEVYEGERNVTYSRMFKNRRCFVKTGYCHDGRVYYRKISIVNREAGEVVLCACMYFPASYVEHMEKVIETIFNKFPN